MDSINCKLPIQRKFLNWLRGDGRHFQIISQVLLLTYGILLLGWDSDWRKYVLAFTGCFSAQLLAIKFKAAPAHSIKSAFITSLGLSLLLKANSPWIYLIAAFFAIGQKFLIRWNNKHLWNPANFGIVIVILLTGQAWMAPGQWGSGALILLLISALGFAVLSNIKRMDTAIAFITTWGLLEYLRVIVYLHWEWDVLFHRLSSGSLWLFTLFMITDPMTTPNRRSTRIIWAIAVAAISYYTANFYFVNGAPFWILFFATPFTPLIDKLAHGSYFQWQPNIHSNSLNTPTK